MPMMSDAHDGYEEWETTHKKNSNRLSLPLNTGGSKMHYNPLLQNTTMYFDIIPNEYDIMTTAMSTLQIIRHMEEK